MQESDKNIATEEAQPEDLSSLTPRERAARVKYKDTLKSMDTEEHIDLWFYRPIGFGWAKLAARLGITPNAITIASIFLGVAAGVLFNSPILWVNVIGMLLLIWANSFDSADGQLARMTGQYSRLGRILDGLAGDLWFITIYFSLTFRELTYNSYFMEHEWAIWTLAWATGFCHMKQASMADLYRQFHLFFLKGKDGSELEDGDDLKARYKEIPWKGHFWSKATMAFYLNYTIQQAKTTPAMQRFRRALRDHFHGGAIPEKLREDFRQASLPLMKYTNILSFNWRVIALFTALFVGQPWLYFAFEFTVLNALMIYMIVRHERICKQFTNRLEEGYYEK